MDVQFVEQPLYPIYSSGIDWVTAFNTGGFNTIMAAHYMDGLFEVLKERGHYVQNSSRMGYIGRASDGAFHGFHDGKSLSILSSDLAREFGVGLIKVSQRISRLDLQVTVDTGAERPVLSRSVYHFATQRRNRPGRPCEFKLTQTHPQGDTLNVNKRTSDTYGRLYDFGAAHRMDEKHRYWRFEMETKRSYSNHFSRLVSSDDTVAAVTTRIVHDWWRSKTFSPPFKPAVLFCSQKPTPTDSRPGLLAWFEDTLSKTIARSVKEFGLQRTLEALRLSAMVNINTERR